MSDLEALALRCEETGDQETEEMIARIIAPRLWQTMDMYHAQMLRKYKGEHVLYEADAFKHKESMATARQILAALRARAQVQS